MSTYVLTSSCRPRITRLASCLAMALGVTLSVAHSQETRAQLSLAHEPVASALRSQSYLQGGAARHESGQGTTRTAQTPLAVTTCDDDANNPASLRAQVAAAISGSTIDLSPLLMVCSKITLGSEIVVAQDKLYLQGPGAGSLAISGNHLSRVFKHTGSGTLDISDLTITEGHYASVDPFVVVAGGCISSEGDVNLRSSVVSDCVLTAINSAAGGGVFAHGDLYLLDSTISYASAYSTDHQATGGGASTGASLTAKYSTVSDNKAYDGNDFYASEGGGAWVGTNFLARGSTISSNYAESGGALNLRSYLLWPTASVVNSTVSNNLAGGSSGIRSQIPLTVSNSTIAFNRELTHASGAGIYMRGAQAQLTLHSSIVADNVGIYGSDEDIDISGDGSAPTTVLGEQNLVIATNFVLPQGTIRECPKLQPLAYNGGFALTHAIAHDSEAIDTGNNASNFATDQRQAPRVIGIQADIGAVEWQTGETDERVFAGGFDGACDQ